MKEKTLKSWECENYVKKGNHKIKYPRKIRGENFKNIKWIKKVIIRIIGTKISGKDENEKCNIAPLQNQGFDG